MCLASCVRANNFSYNFLQVNAIWICVSKGRYLELSNLDLRHVLAHLSSFWKEVETGREMPLGTISILIYSRRQYRIFCCCCCPLSSRSFPSHLARFIYEELLQEMASDLNDKLAYFAPCCSNFFLLSPRSKGPKAKEKTWCWNQELWSWPQEEPKLCLTWLL